MGTMMMGVTTQIFHTSKAGVIAIAAMFVVGFVLFIAQVKQEDVVDIKCGVMGSANE